MIFHKKSTKELVHGVADGAATPAFGEGAEKPGRKAKRSRREKAASDTRRSSFFRTKLFYGVVCIAAGLTIALVGVPVLRAQTTGTVKVVCFAMDVGAGSLITGDELTMVEVSGYHLPLGTVFEASEAIGKYLKVDAISGDYVTTSRLAAQYPGDDPFLLDLPEGKVAISVSLPDLAQSVSGKLRAGDVIQLFAADANTDTRLAEAPPELQYVEVLTATYQDGVDVSDGDYSDGSSSAGDTLSTATLLVNPLQAATIAGLEKQATLYAALVVRGNDVRKAAALEAQDAYFLKQERVGPEAESAAEEAAREREPEAEEASQAGPEIEEAG